MLVPPSADKQTLAVALLPSCAQVAYIPDRRPSTPSWMHDFAATDNYVALIEPPLYMSLGSMMFGKLSGSVSHLFMDWRPEDEVKVYLVPLNGGVSGLNALMDAVPRDTSMLDHVTQ